jgi:hypothetical protein
MCHYCICERLIQSIEFVYKMVDIAEGLAEPDKVAHCRLVKCTICIPIASIDDDSPLLNEPDIPTRLVIGFRHGTAWLKVIRIRLTSVFVPFGHKTIPNPKCTAS